MKLGIIIDSSAGLTKNETEKRGWNFLPLFLTIDNKEYADGVDITPKQYYSMINTSMNVKTSSTPPALITKMFEEVSKNYDHVIVYALSSELSSQTSTLTTFANEFENIHVLDSKGVGTAIVSDLEKLEIMAKNNSTIDEIIKTGNNLTKSLYGIVAIENMDWLVKGGRVSPNVAAMANMLKIIPLISLSGGKLDKFGKGRVFRKAISKAAKAVKEKVGPNYEFTIYNSGNENINEIKESIEKTINETLKVTNFPPIIGNHIGPGSVAIIANKKI